MEGLLTALTWWIYIKSAIELLGIGLVMIFVGLLVLGGIGRR